MRSPTPNNPVPKKAPARPQKTKAKSQPKPQPEPLGEPTAGSEDEEDQEAEDGEQSEAELSLAAKEARLRRLCEQKPSGKIKVPLEIHEMWKKGGVSREELLGMLEDAGWDKDSVDRVARAGYVHPHSDPQQRTRCAAGCEETQGVAHKGNHGHEIGLEQAPCL